MQRQKVQAASKLSYPTRVSYKPRRPGLVCAGLLALMIGAPACMGDIAEPDIAGDMVAPAETWFVSLPAEGSASLSFDAGGWVDFHFEIVVDNADLADFLITRAPGLLERLEEAMAGEPARAFDDVEALREIENEARQLLADEWTGTPDAPVYNFVECTLVVDDLVEHEEIDGDMPA